LSAFAAAMVRERPTVSPANLPLLMERGPQDDRSPAFAAAVKPARTRTPRQSVTALAAVMIPEQEPKPAFAVAVAENRREVLMGKSEKCR
jgi:hypothetical protein